MKKNNKRGFTIVELVIVIAVIAILAAILIPTFSGIVKKANNSAATQEINAAIKVILIEENGKLDANAKYYFIHNGTDEIRYYEYVDGKLEIRTTTAVDGYNNGKITPDNNDVIWYGKDSAAIVEAININAANMTAENKIALEDLENVAVYKVVTGAVPEQSTPAETPSAPSGSN